MKLDKAAVGERYGKALFELAEEKGLTKEFSESLNELREIFDNVPELGKILSDAQLEPDEKEAIFAELSKPFSGYIANFLKVAFSYNRIADVPQMIAVYEKLLDEKQGLTHGEAISAVPLGEDQLTRLEAQFANILYVQKVKLTNVVQPKIVGGVVLKADNFVIDGSIKHRLDQIRRMLGKTS